MITKKPEGIISVQQAQKYFSNYRKENETKFAANEQTIFGWHSLDTYKEYIAYIEEQAEKAGVKVSGIRVYFGADDKLGNQLTYFFSPTYYDEKTGNHEAFDSFYMDENNKPVKIHDHIVNDTPVKGGESDNSCLLNHSKVCPPFCK